MDSLYNQAAWNQPLSPGLNHAHSPIGSIHSPISSVHSPAALSHVGSPIPATLVGCCSPVSAHSPNMQTTVHSPVIRGSPVVENILRSVKQEHLEVDHLRFGSACALENHHESLSSLLRNNEMIAVQNMSMVPSLMGPPHPREILDGKLDIVVFVVSAQRLTWKLMERPNISATIVKYVCVAKCYFSGHSANTDTYRHSLESPALVQCM